MTKSIRLAVLSLFAMLFATPVSAQVLEGTLSLNDSVVAQYATVYIPELRQGTMSDQDGHYKLDEIPAGKWTIEFNYIGYKTERKKITFEKGKTLNQDLRFEEQPIRLAEVFITPNNEDPVVYITNKVIEHYKNIKKRASYDVEADIDVHSQDFDFIPVVLPKAVLWMFHMVFKSVGYGNFIDFCFQHEIVEGSFEASNHYERGEITNRMSKMISGDPTWPDKVRDEVNKNFGKANFFDYPMRELKEKSPKQLKKDGFQFVGTVEEDDKVIDVLKRVKKIEDSDAVESCTIYIVEDEWYIQRIEEQTRLSEIRVECRDFGQGVYLPISVLMKPKQSNFAEMLRKTANEVRTKKEKDTKMVKRIDNYLAGKKEINPSITMCFNAKYNNVKVK